MTFALGFLLDHASPACLSQIDQRDFLSNRMPNQGQSVSAYLRPNNRWQHLCCVQAKPQIESYQNVKSASGWQPLAYTLVQRLLNAKISEYGIPVVRCAQLKMPYYYLKSITCKSGWHCVVYHLPSRVSGQLRHLSRTHHPGSRLSRTRWWKIMEIASHQNSYLAYSFTIPRLIKAQTCLLNVNSIAKSNLIVQKL